MSQSITLKESFQGSSTGSKVFYVLSWIVCGIAIILAITFGALYFTNANASSKPSVCPPSKIPENAKIINDTVVYYDRVNDTEATSKQYQNTYFKNILFKCAGNKVPDSYWDSPFNMSATDGNMKGVTSSPTPATSSTSSTPTTPKTTTTPSTTRFRRPATPTTPTTQETPVSGESVSSDTTGMVGDTTTGTTPSGPETFKNISHIHAPPHRYPFY